MSPKIRRRVGLGLVWLVGLALVASAAVKLLNVAGAHDQLLAHGVTWPRLLGAVELAAAVLLLVPATHRVGLLLCAAYLGGATAVSVGEGTGEMLPSLVLQTLLWTGAALYRPDLIAPRSPVAETAAPAPAAAA